MRIKIKLISHPQCGACIESKPIFEQVVSEYGSFVEFINEEFTPESMDTFYKYGQYAPKVEDGKFVYVDGKPVAEPKVSYPSLFYFSEDMVDPLNPEGFAGMVVGIDRDSIIQNIIGLGALNG